METTLNKKLSGLFPHDNSKNVKGHISAITKGGKVIAYAESSLAGTQQLGEFGRSCHAEIAVLKRINLDDKRKVSKYTLWNIRWTKDGKIANSKPCLNCQKVLSQMGIKNIIFSDSNGNFYKNKIQCIICKKSSGFVY